VRSIEVGDVLFGPGGSSYEVMVVLEGCVSVLVGSGANERELVRQTRGDLMAELNLFTGQGSDATGVVREGGSVLSIPPGEFRALVGRDLVFGDFVLQMLFRRRRALERLQLGVRIVGSRFDRETQRLREFVVRNRLLHEWVDVDDARARAWLAGVGADGAVPVVFLGGGEYLVNPANAELAGRVGLRDRRSDAATRTFDLVVVGGGPGGLAAGVYGAAGGLSTALLDAVALGGQAATSARIENYLGFPAGVSGAELAERAQLQATKFGVEVMVPCRAVGLSERDGFHVVSLDDGGELVARCVILALGVRYRRLPLPRLAEFEGVGVAYAVDVARAQLEPGAPAVVVGGANSAGQAAMTLAEEGHRVSLVVREPALIAMAGYLRERLAADPSVEVLLGGEVREVDGHSRLERVTVEIVSTGERRMIDAGAMVILIGAEPPTEWLADELARAEDGSILTGPGLGDDVTQSERWRTLGRGPFLVESSRPGVFAIGDVRSGSTRMVAPAVGDGGMAVRFAGEHLARTEVR
jgi:thioredoxin reductase (NADPH)